MTSTNTLALATTDAADSPATEIVDRPELATAPRPEPRPQAHPPVYRRRGVAGRYLGAVPVGLAVWWQLVALAAVVYGGWSTGVRLGVTIGCAIVLLASMVRWRGRWLPEWLVTYLRFRRRTSQAATVAVPPLRAVAGELDTRAYTDRTGNIVGLARDGACWTSLIRVTVPLTTDAQETQHHVADLLEILAASQADDLTAVSAVQLVSYATMPPTTATAAQPATGSAAEPTTESTGPSDADPAADTAAAPVTYDQVRRQYWVALRLDPVRARQAVRARGGGETGESRTIAAATLRLAARLLAEGYTAEVADDADLVVQLATALGVPATPSPEGDTPPVESWQAWSVGALHQACFALRRHPATTDAMAQVAGRLATAPALFTCVATQLERRPTGEVVSQTYLRLGVPAGPDPTERDEALRRAAEGLGPDVRRLDGVHGLVLPATLPLARRIR